MNRKNGAALIALATFFFAAGIYAQTQENIGGIFYSGCGPTDEPAVTMELNNHLRITVFKPSLVAEEAYRTPKEVFEGEQANMEVNLCDSEMKNCKFVEGVFTTYKVDGETIEAAIEYFDGTEVQGDAESIQGHTSYFKVHRDKDRAKAVCG
jgi:hypothetical protein